MQRYTNAIRYTNSPTELKRRATYTSDLIHCHCYRLQAAVTVAGSHCCMPIASGTAAAGWRPECYLQMLFIKGSMFRRGAAARPVRATGRHAQCPAVCQLRAVVLYAVADHQTRQTALCMPQAVRRKANDPVRRLWLLVSQSRLHP